MPIPVEKVTIRMPTRLKDWLDWQVYERRKILGQRDASLNGLIVNAIEGWARREEIKRAKAQEEAGSPGA